MIHLWGMKGDVPTIIVKIDYTDFSGAIHSRTYYHFIMDVRPEKIAASVLGEFKSKHPYRTVDLLTLSKTIHDEAGRYVFDKNFRQQFEVLLCFQPMDE